MWTCAHFDGVGTGFYEPIRQRINRLFRFGPEEQLAATSIGAGALSGVIGGICVKESRKRRLTFME